ncbi:MAG: glycoside hydrolase family 9 protein [Bacteroidales bacterium]|jgi:endoglucanase|nr:glycoside hydrolase family 9 protein [Bacteroidales bacterium]
MKKILLLCMIAISLATYSQESTSHIRLNQIGFLPYAEKLAAVVDISATSFEIIDTLDNVVFTNSLSSSALWSSSGESVQIADFSIFSTPGTYKIRIDGYGESVRFAISDTVFSEINNAIVKAFYFNRASTELLPEHAGAYARNAGHPDTAVIILPSAAGPTRVAGDTISAPKGWYDAGDYNKYIVNSGITVGTLLQAYESYSEYYDTLTWNIPESGNDIADLLDEIRWNLDWMLTMQDPADGGVYNKTTSAQFSGMIMPDEDNATRYVVAKGTAASLDFAAVMAMAGRVYADIDSVFADSCLRAAEYAWEWAENNPNVSYSNPGAQDGYPAVSTGGYGDNYFNDEKIWAASELLISTGKDSVYASDINLYAQFNTPNWRSLATLCLFSLYTHRETIGFAVDTAQVKEIILSKATGLRDAQQSHPYRITTSNFAWGSNSIVANESIMLLHAFRISHEKSFLNAAFSCYDYILGRNATEYCFITEFGTKGSRNVHHRVSEADALPGSVPGFLAGGPNGNAGSECGTSYSNYDAKAYKDENCSYTTNEIAINWQAPMTYLAHAIPLEYNTWLQSLPADFAIPSVSSIELTRVQTNSSFSVFSNTEWHLLSDDTWYEFSEDTIIGSAFINLIVTQENETDSVRSGEFHVVIDTDTVSTIAVNQIGRMKEFRIEAEDYISMDGVQTEATEDVEGEGINVGYIDNGDSMTYTIDITHAGSYAIDYRTASESSTDGELHMLIEDSIYSLVHPRPSGDWQNWETITDTAYFEEGIYEITLFSLFGGFNLNYMDFAFITSENIAPEHEPTIIPNSIYYASNSSEIHIENPVTDNSLSIFGLQTNTQYTVALYTITGNFVSFHEINSASPSVPVTQEAGTYICEIIDEENNLESFIFIITQ